ncbi:MAG: 4Fe-4S dicluster domain-containing protein [Oligoflexus sp.]
MPNQTPQTPNETTVYKISADALQILLQKLREHGYQVVGPTIRDEAIIYDELESISDLPQGWQDEQAPGKYQIKNTNTKHYFAYASSPHSWKKYLQAPRIKLWQGQLKSDETSMQVQFQSKEDRSKKYAFFGVRSCDIQAVRILDHVYEKDRMASGQHYFAIREPCFILSIDCSHPSKNCFCTSMGTGPLAESGFDLALTELCAGDQHFGFTVRVGSQQGASFLQDIPHTIASTGEQQAAQSVIDSSKMSISKRMETDGIKDLLYSNLEHPRWDQVAERCLSCANCTMVCPTCFCQTVEDHTDLTGQHTARWLRWDSCFTADFSYIHGGSLRPSTKSRYRQWLTHKLASWIDQFGESGCVGCGRCITWCPVGIDITEEVKEIAASQ